MTRKCWSIVVLIVAGTCAGRAALIASWNFNASMAPSGGTEISTASLDTSGAKANITSGGGTSQNRIGSDINGNALLISAGSSAGENGQTIVFSLGMSSYDDLVLTYATVRTSTGFTEQDWSYSTDGTSYTALTAIKGISIPTASGTITSSSYAVETVDFSSVSTHNNPNSIWIRLTLNGATGASGSDRFDNIQFNADVIPEPAGWGAMAGAGLLALCGWRGWRQSRHGENLKS